MGLKNLLKSSSASVTELRNDARILTQIAGKYQEAADRLQEAQTLAGQVGNDPDEK